MEVDEALGQGLVVVAVTPPEGVHSADVGIGEALEEGSSEGVRGWSGGFWVEILGLIVAGWCQPRTDSGSNAFGRFNEKWKEETLTHG